MTDIYRGRDLPLAQPGGFDSVIGVDESGGALRRYPVASASPQLGYLTRADLYADLDHIAGTIRRVTNDSTASYNGDYIKVGASGAGSWTKADDRVTDLEEFQAEVEPLLDVIEPDAQASVEWAVVDAAGRVCAVILSDGTMRAAKLAPVLLEPETTETALSDSQVVGGQSAKENVVTDAEGRISAYTEADGTRVFASVRALLGSMTALNVESLSIGGAEVRGEVIAAPRLHYSYAHVFSYGQSLSVGELATPIQTTAQAYDSLSFVGGVRPLDTLTAPTAYASLIPLVENTGGANSEAQYGGIDTPGETPLGGMFDAVKELLADEDSVTTSDADYRFIGTASGKGATTILELMKGNVHYNRLLDEVGYGKALADADSRSYGVPAIIWLQGEAEDASSTTAYRDRLERLHAQLNADIKAITGQADDVLMLSYQTPTKFDVAVAQLRAAQAIPAIHVAGPIYQLSFADTVAHLDGEGSKLAGAYFGKAYKRLVIDGEPWKPMQAVSVTAAGNAVYVKLHVPTGKATIDTTLVGAVSQSGFVILDGSAANVPITDVSIVSRDTIRLLTGSAIASGFTVQYATALAGGNIRDQDGDTVIFEPAGLNYPLHNWLTAFELTI